MRAAVLTAYQEPLEIQDVERPEPDADGVVARVDACGVCRSDWHGWQGNWEWFDYKPPLGHILGHEPAGTVIEVGEDVESVDVGDAVAIPFNFACGTCHECRMGYENLCENHLGLGFQEGAPGAFAEEVPIPNAEINAVPLPESVSPVEMAGLGCRFMTAFRGMAHQAEVGRGEDVVVYGLGGIGLSAVQIADALGGNVIGVDIMDEKLEMAEELGAVETVNADDGDPVEAVRSLTDGGADVSLDALGIDETCQNAINSLGTRGRHVQIGLTGREQAGYIDLPTDTIVMNEIEIRGSSGIPPARYGEIFDMVRTGKLDPGAVVTDHIGLDDVNDELEAMTDYATVGIPVVDEFA
ncbi:MAG: zinc-dependent alcohol dehydrogenase family protein [Halobacteriales archaeon]